MATQLEFPIDETRLREMWADPALARHEIAAALGIGEARLDRLAARLALGPNICAARRGPFPKIKSEWGYNPKTWPDVHECFEDHPDANRRSRYSGNLGRPVFGNPYAETPGHQSSADGVMMSRAI